MALHAINSGIDKVVTWKTVILDNLFSAGQRSMCVLRVF